MSDKLIFTVPTEYNGVNALTFCARSVDFHQE